jgi:hypothetical protein
LLAAFHATVLDHGSLPMPTLARSIAADWTGLADPVDADVVVAGAGAVRHHYDRGGRPVGGHGVPWA